jgi:hypothetical protein
VLRLLVLVLALLASACVVTPRVPVDVSRAVARDDMRLLRTESVDLYYPAHFEREARALAERVEGCAAQLRELATGHGGLYDDRIELLFPDVPFNNAFVMPPLNGDNFSVVPTHWTLDVATEFGLPPGPDYVACHEIAHYIHNQQTLRTWGGLNKAFGYIISPQLGLDAWFHEGLATYYEQQLSPGTGRPAWPGFSGLFHAAVAGKGVRGGDLSAYKRQVHVGNQYLYGYQFVTWLVQTYGEERLWRLIERQGKSFFFPFNVNGRFRRTYGKSLSRLIDEFSAYVQRAYPERARPAGQERVRKLGTNARYARAPDGTEAVVTEDMDVPATLMVYGPDGHQWYSKRLVDILPSRDLVVGGATLVSGLRFSRDAHRLYFAALDLGVVFQRIRLFELDVRSGELRRLADDLSGVGGDVDPEGKSYVYVRASGRGHELSLLDLASGATRVLHVPDRGVYLSSATFSPDGATILAGVFDGAFAFRLFDARTGAVLASFSAQGRPVHDATFVDADRILFTGEHEGRFQIFLYQRSADLTVRLTDAPYLAQFARAGAGKVRFLNREANHYTLDEVALPPAVAAASAGTGDAVLTADFAAAGASMGSEQAAAALTLAEGPITPLPEPVRFDLGKPEDEPYSAFPRVLVPSLRVPQASIALADGSGAAPTTVGLYLGGTDALGKHRWGASVGVQIPSLRVSGSVAYLNAQLAPLLWMISASQSDFEERHRRRFDDDGDGDLDERRWVDERKRQRDAALQFLAPLRTSFLGLALHVTNDYQPDSLVLARSERTLSGATLSFDHAAIESTPMSGPRRGFALNLSSSYYPETLGTLGTQLADARGQLDLYSPLPLSRRATAWLGLRGRGLIHDEPWRLLEVGGNTGGILYDYPGERELSAYPGLPPRRRFQEPLRGFETLPFAVHRIAIADLRLRYPLIIDRGTATSLWFMPAFFLRQLDLELFAAGATDTFRAPRKAGHLAVGGAVNVRFVWLGPVAFGYQLSRRLTDDESLQHLLTLSADLAP